MDDQQEVEVTAVEPNAEGQNPYSFTSSASPDFRMQGQGLHEDMMDGAPTAVTTTVGDKASLPGTQNPVGASLSSRQKKNVPPKDKAIIRCAN